MTDERIALEAEIQRLRKMNAALMDRAERSTDTRESDFDLFQMAVMLNDRIRERTADLEKALRENERISRFLRASESKYHALVDQSLVGIGIIERGRFSYGNPRFCEIFGYEASELIGLTPFDLVVAQDAPLVREQIRRRECGESIRVEYQVRGRRKDGKEIKIEIVGNIAEVNGEKVLVSVVQDVTERCRVEQELLHLQESLRELSVRDPLTGLHNRRYLDENLARELFAASRSGTSVAVIMGDLDHFKLINDRHGHPAGDAVIRSFAALLMRLSRSSDLNCRIGGEEFLIVLPGMDAASAQARAEALRSDWENEPVPWGEGRIAATASFGIAVYPNHGATSEALIASADRALYAAKQAGRNRVCMA